MKKSTKIALITAAVLILAGSMLFAGVMNRLDWRTEKLSTRQYETNTHVIDEAFDSIDVKTMISGIALAKAEDGTCRVICHEDAKANHRVTVENGVLTVAIDDQRTWLDHINLGSKNPLITIFLPGDAYDDLYIDGTTGGVDVPEGLTFENVFIRVNTGGVIFKADTNHNAQIIATTGSIRVHDIAAKSLHLKVTTGTVGAENVTCEESLTVLVTTGHATVENAVCKTFASGGDTGDIRLVNVIAEGKMDIERSTGDVVLDACDAGEMHVETDTGDVTGMLLSGKTFIVETDTGSVRVPRDISGGRCEIETDTGDIRITIQ